MIVSDDGINLIKRFEGCKLTAYKCPAGVWTIGYGHTGPDVIPGLVWTPEQAENALRDDVTRFAAGVRRIVYSHTTGPQFNALVSLAYNIGINALHKSTLLRMHNRANYQQAAQEFARWNKSNGRILGGLVARRSAEAELYQQGIPK